MPSEDIEHLPADGRLRLRIDGPGGPRWAVIDYALHDNVMAINHTFVPREFEGRGIAGRLTQAALDHARANGLKVAAHCSYAAAYIRRHPETQSLLA